MLAIDERPTAAPIRSLPTGLLYLFAAILGGVFSFTSGTQAVIGSPATWWVPVVFASAILLFVDGFSLCLPAIPPPLRIAIAAAIPLAISSIFLAWPLRIWLMAAALAILEAIFLIVNAHSRLNGTAAVTASFVLVLASAASVTQLVGNYLDGYTSSASPWTATQILTLLIPPVAQFFIFFAAHFRAWWLILDTHR